MLKKRYELKENSTGKVMPEFQTIVDVTMTETHLIFEFDCKNSQFYSAYDKYNDPIWEGDVCEAFICTNGKKDWYYEIEIAPNNTVFLKHINNKGFDDIDEFDIEENFIESEVKIIGNDYKLKFSVPLDKIGYNKETGILYNIFRIETEGGIQEKNLFAMNPTMSFRFHNTDYFVELK